MAEEKKQKEIFLLAFLFARYFASFPIFKLHTGTLYCKILHIKDKTIQSTYFNPE